MSRERYRQWEGRAQGARGGEFISSGGSSRGDTTRVYKYVQPQKQREGIIHGLGRQEDKEQRLGQKQGKFILGLEQEKGLWGQWCDGEGAASALPMQPPELLSPLAQHCFAAAPSVPSLHAGRDYIIHIEGEAVGCMG